MNEEKIKKIMSIIILTTGEGKRLCATYSEISLEGELISENNQVNRIIVNDEILEVVLKLEKFAKGIIEDN